MTIKKTHYKQSKKRYIEKGFSLLEMLIAIMIMGLLTSIVVPSYTKIQRNAKENILKSIGYNIQMALESYYITHGDYPHGSLLTISQLEDVLIQADQLSKAHENPFTKQPFSGTDASGLIDYNYSPSSQDYQLRIYGYLNQEVVLELMN